VGISQGKRSHSILEIKNLKKYYSNKVVLTGVDFVAHSGKITGLLGPNGSGKTTCFNVMTGILAPDSGNIILDGKDITCIPIHKRITAGMSYLPQESSVFKGLSVEDNIIIALEIMKVPGKRIPEILQKTLNSFGIYDIRKQPVTKISGGQRRRVEIARSVIGNPKFLLLDEPFVGVDPLVMEDIRKILINLRNTGMGIVITDHNVWEVLQIVDHASILFEGKIVISGSVQDVINNDFARKVYLGERFFS